MRLRSRHDGNHAEIVRALKRIGCGVLDLSRVGSGCPDLLVSVRNGRSRDLLLMEIKTAQGKTSAVQRAFEADGWPVFVVRSVNEALALVGCNV